MDLKLAKPGFWMSVLLGLLVVGIQTSLSIPLGLIDQFFTKVLQLPPPGLVHEPIVIGAINIIAFGSAIALALYLNRLSFGAAFRLHIPKGLPRLFDGAGSSGSRRVALGSGQCFSKPAAATSLSGRSVQADFLG